VIGTIYGHLATAIDSGEVLAVERFFTDAERREIGAALEKTSGALGAASVHPWKAMLLAWVPWAVIRIASFVTLGVVLSGPMLARQDRFPYRLRDQRRWIWLGFAGLLADVVLKWALAPSWREMIRAAAGW